MIGINTKHLNSLTECNMKSHTCILLFIVAILCGISSSIGSDIQTPSRGVMKKECVQQVPHGSTIVRDDSNNYIVIHPESDQMVSSPIVGVCENPETVLEYRTDTEAPYHGWQAYSFVSIQTSYSAFVGSWTVPTAPFGADSSTVIFLFLGLQCATTETGFDNIIQPVLRYGNQQDVGMSWVCSFLSFFLSLSYEYTYESVTSRSHLGTFLLQAASMFPRK